MSVAVAGNLLDKTALWDAWQAELGTSNNIQPQQLFLMLLLLLLLLLQLWSKFCNFVMVCCICISLLMLWSFASRSSTYITKPTMLWVVKKVHLGSILALLFFSPLFYFCFAVPVLLTTPKELESVKNGGDATLLREALRVFREIIQVPMTSSLFLRFLTGLCLGRRSSRGCCGGPEGPVFRVRRVRS
jgi:hypothetical protein